MGRIYRARRDSRDLAIKVINPATERISSEAQERMAREASIWKRLVHQHIVRLHEVNQPEGLFYLTMDWMPRGSLRERLRGGLEPREAVRVAIGVAQALAYLSDTGYIHRDVKPENILFDAADEPRLTDFGIAKSMEDDVGVQTRAGIFIGTLNYAPPEQLRDPSSCTGQADVFALGLVLYEMLTGVQPSRDTIGGVVEEAFDRVTQPALADLLRRMLAEEARVRPSIGAVAHQLEELEV